MTNSRLAQMFKLSSKVEIFIPSTVDIDKKTSNIKYVNKALKLLNDCFGGSTATDGLGSWQSGNKTVKEKVKIVFGYCTEIQLNENIEKVIDFCEGLKDDMKQEAIALTINGEMYFI